MMDFLSNFSRSRARCLALFAVGYILLAWLSHWLSIKPGFYFTFWLPGGLLISTLLLTEKRLWPLYLAAAFFANLCFALLLPGLPFLLILFGFAASAIEAVTGAWLVLHFCKVKDNQPGFLLNTVGQMMALVVFGGFIGTIAGSLAGTITTALFFPELNFAEFALGWWAADATGIICLAPLVITFADPARTNPEWLHPRHRLTLPLHMLESTALFAGIIISTVLVIGNHFSSSYEDDYLIIPFLAWAAVRFNARGTALAGMILSLTAQFTLVHLNQGDRALSVPSSIFALQSYLFVFQTTALAVAVLFEERRRAEARLQRSEERFRAIADAQVDLVSRWQPGGNRVYVNDAYCRFFGMRREDLEGRPFTVLTIAEDRGIVDKYMRRVQQSTPRQPISEMEARYIRADGELRWLHFINRAIFDPHGRLVEIQSIGRDITSRKLTEQKTEESLHEKELLLKEIHHRVKNNLQIVNSLLDLQSDYLDDERVRHLFKQTQARVRSMALVHEKLYQSHNLASINFADYIQSLTNYLITSYNGYAYDIHFDFQAQNAEVPVDMAVPCGLILGELVANAIKHAFPGGREGAIVIGLSMDNGGQTAPLKTNTTDHKLRAAAQPAPPGAANASSDPAGHPTCTLIVRDNGVGLPPDLDFANTSSLGLQLVHMLSKQINARIAVRSDSRGTEVAITFTP